jgi:hypothetical protein
MLVVDLGLLTYATITCINTGDVWEIGNGALQHMRINFNEPLAELQRQLSCIIAATESVRLALESLEKLRLGLYHDDTDGTLSDKMAAREAAEQRHWTMQSEAWRTHRIQNEAFKNLLGQMATIRARKRAYVARMRKACSALLSSVGSDGMVLLPTNLMDQKMKGGFRSVLSSYNITCFHMSVCM